MPRSKEEILADIRSRMEKLSYRPTMVDIADTPQYQTGSTLVPMTIPPSRPAQMRQGKPEQVDTGEYRQVVEPLDKLLSFGSGVAKGVALLPEPTDEEKKLVDDGFSFQAGSTNPALSLVQDLYVKGRSVESGWGTVGEIAGAIVPISKAFKVAGVVKVGAEKVLAVVIPKVAQNAAIKELGETFAAKTVGRAIHGGVAGAVYGTAKEAIKSTVTGEKMDVGEIGMEARNFAIAEPIAIPVGQSIKKGWRATKQFFTRTKYKLKSEAGQEFVVRLKDEQEIVAGIKGSIPDDLSVREVSKLGKDGKAALVAELRNPDIAQETMSPLAQKIRSGLDSFRAQMKELGVDIGELKGYFPQIPMHSKKIWDDLRPVVEKLQLLLYEASGQKAIRFGEENFAKYVGDIKMSPETERLVGYLKRTGQWSGTSDDVLRLAKMGNSDAMGVVMPTTRFAKSRPFDLSIPDPAKLESVATLLENDPVKVLEMYGQGAAQTIARRKVWGNEHENFWNILGRAPSEETGLINKMMDAQTGVRFVKEGFSPKVQDFFDSYINFGAATKIGGGTSAIPNIVQFMGVANARAGTWTTLVGSAKALAGDIAGKIRKAGALGIYDPYSIASETSGGAALATTSRIATTPFRLANELQAMISGAQGREAIQSWHKLANVEGNGFRALNARHQLRELNINYKEPLTEKLLQAKTFRFTVDTQLYRDVTNEPIWMSNPKLAPLLFLKKYGLKQAYAVKDIIMRDSMIRDETGKLVAVNPLPAVRLAMGGLGGGEFVRWGRKKIEELSTGQVRMTAGDINVIDRIVEDFAAMGAYGILSDALRPLAEGGILEWGDRAGQGKAEATGRFIGRTIKPTVVSDIDRFGDVLVSLYTDIAKYDTETAMKRNLFKLPLGGIPSQALRRIRPEAQKEDEIRNQKAHWVSGILDAVARGDMDKKNAMFHGWNDAHEPQFWIKLEDVSGEVAGKKLIDNIWDKLEMMSDGFKRPKKK